MLMIRLQRVGRTNIPTFRVVLTDSKNSTKSGKAKEVLGHFDPVKNDKKVNAERVKYWMSVGAQLSGTVHNFLVQEKIISGKKINVLPKKKPIVKAEEVKKGEVKTEAVAAPVAEAPTETPATPEVSKEESPKEEPKA